MTRDEINDAYFEWMYQLVCSNLGYLKSQSYHKLLRCLHSIDFNYTIAMDGNRAEDGIALRYRFGYEHSYEPAMIAAYLDMRPCSVLEMMVALAVICEDRIMYDPDLGDRTSQWFWVMVSNLRLDHQDDEHFDEFYTVHAIEKFINRDYKRDGTGGLFTVSDPMRDMRSAEIWYQMNWYLSELTAR